MAKQLFYIVPVDIATETYAPLYYTFKVTDARVIAKRMSKKGCPAWRVIGSPRKDPRFTLAEIQEMPSL